MKHRNPSLALLAPAICSVFGIRPPSLSVREQLEDLAERVGRAYRICLIVIDGLGNRQFDFHGLAMPYLSSLRDGRCTVLRAESPPRTSSNVASLLTGAPVSVHGVTSKSMDLNCESLFDVMSKCAMTTSIVARDKNSLKCLFAQKAGSVVKLTEGDDRAVFRRAEMVIQDLRPHFLWIHLSDLDSISHIAGPESTEASRALMRIDRAASELASLLDRHSYAAIMTADHGSHAVPDGKGGMTAAHDGSDEGDFLVPLLSVKAKR